MDLTAKLDRLLSYHVSSPQFKFYSNRFNEQVSYDLYNGVISPEEYDDLTKKLERYVEENSTYNSFILSLLSKFNYSTHTHDFFSMESYGPLKDLIITTRQIYKMCEPILEDKFITEDARISFLMTVLKSFQSTASKSNKSVYFFIDKMELALIACLKDYSITQSIAKISNVFYSAKEIILKEDREFYDDVYEYLLNKGDYKDSGLQSTEGNKINESSIFSTNKTPNDYKVSKFAEGKINNYFDFQLAVSNYYKECFGVYTSRFWTSKRIYNCILEMDCPDRVKDYLTTEFSSYREKLFPNAIGYVRVYDRYLTYGNDSLYLSSKEEFMLFKDVYETLETASSLKSILSFCIGQAELAYFSNNSTFNRNITLLNNLQKFGSAGLLPNPKEVYEQIIEKLKWGDEKDYE